MATTSERDLCTRMPTNDIFLTSAGVGHHYRPGYYFPDSSFKSVLHEPLPAELCQPDQILPSDVFKTTQQDFHDHKFPCEPTKGDIKFKKSPGLWNVHYLKDHKEKLGKGGWRRPLSPSNQKSETIDEFDNKPPLYEPERWLSQQPFNLHNHHIEGPSKRIVASTQNPKMGGRTLYPKDQEVLRHLDPYLTTNMKVHRAWDPKEMKGYPKKDIPTYWECEEYPKAWGFGLKQNPLPKSAIPRERPPMRDTTVFKSATSIRRVPATFVPVPHTGLRTEYTYSFERPSDVKSTEDCICPVDTPYVLPPPGPRPVYSVPGMYKTEYMNVGKREPVTV